MSSLPLSIFLLNLDVGVAGCMPPCTAANTKFVIKFFTFNSKKYVLLAFSVTLSARVEWRAQRARGVLFCTFDKLLAK